MSPLSSGGNIAVSSSALANFEDDDLERDEEEVYKFPILRTEVSKQLLPLKSMTFDINMQISTAFVTIEATWVNTVQGDASCTLELPTTDDSTVTGGIITIGQRTMDTSVVAIEDAKELTKENPPDAEMGQYDTYRPEIFRLPVRHVPLNTEIHVKIGYFESMDFFKGAYFYSLPFSCPDACLQSGSRLQDVINVNITMNGGTPHMKLGKFGFPMVKTRSIPGRFELTLDKTQEWPPSKDLVMSYYVWSSTISATCLVEPPPKNTNEEGSFCMFVTPPSVQDAAYFSRSVVFLLDKSGSMAGKTMESARQAMNAAIDALTPNDTFQIIAFDDTQHPWSQGLVPATKQYIDSAKHFVSRIHPSDLTDILTPVQQAIQLLHTAQGFPLIFVITDGAVANERQICEYVQKSGTLARVMTFGIGSYCNTFFLKMLGSIGRGYSSSCVERRRLSFKMSRFVNSAAFPVLKEVTVGISGLEQCFIYPYPIPDLFCGKPLVFSGRYRGTFPREVVLRGILPNGHVWESNIQVVRAPDIPITRIFTKQRMDLLTAQAWLTADDRIKAQVVDLSIKSGIPSAHTTMVSYEKRDSFGEETDKKMGKGCKMLLGGAVVGGVVAISAGLGAFSFGNLGASTSNLSIDANLGSMGLGGLGDLGENVIGAAGTALNGVADAGSAMLEGVSGVGGDLFSGIGDVAGNVGEVASGLGSGIGDVASGLGSGIGEVASGLGSGIGDVAGNLGDAVGSGASAALDAGGKIAGAAGEGLGELGSGIASGVGAGVEAIPGCCGSIGEVFEGLGDCINDLGALASGFK